MEKGVVEPPLQTENTNVIELPHYRKNIKKNN